MKEGNIMKELFQKQLAFRMYTIFYCQFGRDEMKVSFVIERSICTLMLMLVN